MCSMHTEATALLRLSACGRKGGVCVDAGFTMIPDGDQVSCFRPVDCLIFTAVSRVVG